jgi:hypothetical protein
VAEFLPREQQSEVGPVARSKMGGMLGDATTNAPVWRCDCGATNDPDANFCPACGRARPHVERYCGRCGARAEDASQAFCASCGAGLSSAASGGTLAEHANGGPVDDAAPRTLAPEPSDASGRHRPVLAVAVAGLLAAITVVAAILLSGGGGRSAPTTSTRHDPSSTAARAPSAAAVFPALSAPVVLRQRRLGATLAAPHLTRPGLQRLHARLSL